MAKRNPADVAFVMVGGRSIGGDLTAFEDKVEAILEQSEALGDAWTKQSYTGLRTANLSIEGFYDDRQGGVHDALNTSADLAPSIVYTLEGSTYGAGFVGYAAGARATYEQQFSLGSLVKVKAEFKTQGAVDYGKQLWYPHVAASTGATTGAAIDNGVETTGGAGYLQYNATDGEANIRILHSSDNLTFSTLFTFAQTVKGVATGSFGSERVVTSGVVRRYAAIDITTATATGAGTTAGLNFFVGLARNLSTG